MRLHTALRLSVTLMALILPASDSFAQERSIDQGEPSTGAAVQVTPYVALGSLGTAPVGTFVTFPISARWSVENEISYRRGEGSIHALSSSANVVFTLPPVRGVFPYLTAGAGLHQYGSPLVFPNGVVATQSKIAVALNAGGGIKVPVNERVGMRTDVRWFKPLARDASESWRVAHGVSFGRSR